MQSEWRSFLSSEIFISQNIDSSDLNMLNKKQLISIIRINLKIIIISKKMNIKFLGRSSFNYKNGNLHVNIDQIMNQRDGGISGKLRITLLTLDQLYTGGSLEDLSPYILVQFKLDQLEGGYSYKKILKKFKARWSERTYTLLILQEQRGNEYFIVDCIRYD